MGKILGMFSIGLAMLSFLFGTTVIVAAQPVTLTHADCQAIVAAAKTQANNEVSGLRKDLDGNPQTTKMHIACVDRNGTILVFRSMPDAWAGSIDIARAKANTARAFSSNENALSSRSIGCLSQPGGPLWQIGNSNQAPAVRGNAVTQGKVGGLIQFPGGLPLYKDADGDGVNDTLVGAIGVSGDGVEQDENVAQAGTEADQPGAAPDYQAPAVLQGPFFFDTGSGADGDSCTLNEP